MATKNEVINLIKQKIVDSEVYVENLKGDDHLQVTVISSEFNGCLLYTSPSPRDSVVSRMPSSA